VRLPWYPRRAEYRWWQLTTAAARAGATAGQVPGSAAAQGSSNPLSSSYPLSGSLSSTAARGGTTPTLTLTLTLT